MFGERDQRGNKCSEGFSGNLANPIIHLSLIYSREKGGGGVIKKSTFIGMLW